MKIGTRLSIGFAILIIAITASSLISIYEFGIVDDGINSIVFDKYPKTVAANDIIDNVNEVGTLLRDLIIFDESKIPVVVEGVKVARDRIIGRIKELDSTVKSPTGIAKLEAVKKARELYVASQTKIIDLVKANNKPEAIIVLDKETTALYNNYKAVVNDLIKYQNELMMEDSIGADNAIASAENIGYIILFISLIIAIILAVYLTKSIVKPIRIAIETADNLAKGNLSIDIDTSKTDETGELLKAMKSLADDLLSLNKEVENLTVAAVNGKLDTRANYSKYQGQHSDLVRGINSLLDAVINPLNVTAEYVDRISKGDIPPKITDEYKGDFNEIKNNLNQCIDAVNLLVSDAMMLAGAAVEGKLDTRANSTRHQGDFRKVVDGVNRTLDSVINPLNVAAEYVDRIAKGDIPPKIVDNYNGDFNEIKNNLNQCIDSLNGLINDMQHMSNQHDLGDIDIVMNTTKFNGAYRTMAAGVNTMVNGHISVKKKAMACFMEFGDGNLDAQIEIFPGKKVFINEAIESVRANIKELVKDASMLANAAVQGKLDTRADASKHKGDFRKIVEGVNNTLDSVIGPLNVAAEYVDRIAKGDIPPKITDNYNGDFNAIKNNLNQAIDAVDALVTDAGMLAKAAVEGRLNTRADASRHNGDFRAIVQGVNDTLDNVIGPLNVAAEYVDRIAKGDLPNIITDNYNGDFNDIKNNLNVLINASNEVAKAIESVSNGNVNISLKERSSNDTLVRSVNILAKSIGALVTDVNQLSANAIKGNLNARADASKHEGDFEKIINGINDTLAAVVNAINSMSSSIMMGDAEGNITFVNTSNQKLLSDQEGNIKMSLPHFSAKDILGKNIDLFHKNPAHQKNLLKNLTKMHNAQIHLGNGIFKLNVSPITDGNGIRTAYVVEWLNYSDEANFNSNLTSVIKSMTEGKLRERMNPEILGGIYQSTAENINSMLEAIIKPVFVAADYVDKISKGDMPELITDEYKGDFNELKNNLNTCINAINTLIADSVMLSTAAVEGRLTTRADATKHFGDYRKIVEGVNNTLDEVLNPINDAAEVLKQMAEGNLSVKVTGDYRGDHAIIKNALNTTIDMLPLKEAILVLKEMANGNLTVKMTSEYKGDALEMKNAINDTVDSMNEILGQVKTTVDEVTNGAMQVSDASTALSQGATEQAASLEEITSSMTELGSQTKTNAENANQANILTSEAKNAAEKGTKEMSQLSLAMSEITESSRNISKIIKVIDEIAFQTNLLALNAAVEAARAGRHGKGFAVVAEEVRNLAARSATAAKETSDLIENSIKTVENGSVLAQRTSEALEEIRSGAIKSADIVGEIATSSNEQAQGIAQINEGLVQIDKVTQTNTASAEESASASEELSGQAAQLKNMIARFTIMEDQNTTYKTPTYSAPTRMISTSRDKSRRLPEANLDDYNSHHHHQRPEDLIKLDEDDFGKY